MILANEQHDSLKNCRRVSLIPSVSKSIIDERDRILESKFILAGIFVAELVKN